MNPNCYPRIAIIGSPVLARSLQQSGLAPNTGQLDEQIPALDIIAAEQKGAPA